MANMPVPNSGVVSIEQHWAVIERLTGVIQRAMVDAGEDVLPAEVGKVWHDALAYFAPHKLDVFKEEDVLARLLPYCVSVIDVPNKTSLLDCQYVTMDTYRDILSQLVEFDEDEVNLYVRELTEIGHFEIRSKGMNPRYTVIAVDRKRFRLESTGLIFDIRKEASPYQASLEGKEKSL